MTLAESMSVPNEEGYCPSCHFSEPLEAEGKVSWPHEPGCPYDGLSYWEAAKADRKPRNDVQKSRPVKRADTQP